MNTNVSPAMTTAFPSIPMQRLVSSFPNSVWERKGAKLRFARLSMSNTVLRASVQFLDEFKTEF